MRKKAIKQMRRRELIKENSLIVGIDVGKSMHSAALCSSGGQLLRLLPKVYNSAKGFSFLLSNIREVAKEHNLSSVIVGVEPTGPWWQPIMYHLSCHPFNLVFVRPGAVKEFNSLSDSSNSKTDQQDAFKIAQIIRDGHFLDGPVIIEGAHKEMRLLCSQRKHIQKELGSSFNRLFSVLQVYFPELRALFSSLGRKSLLALLEHYPMPEDLLAAGQQKISGLLKSASNNKLDDKKARAIYLAAQTSIGIKDGLIAARLEIANMVEKIRLLQRQKDRVEEELIGFAKTTKYFQPLLSMPGVGPLTASLILGTLGEPGRFQNAREIVSYAGMDPVQRQSGQKKSLSFSSKKGHSYLRSIFYLIALRSIKLGGPLRSFYERKSLSMASKSKKKALCAASVKIVHILFAKIKDGPYQNKISVAA